MEWEWVSAVVGLGGLLVAGLTVYLNYRPRSTYQERIYDRRLDAYSEIVRRLGDLHDEAQRVLAGGDSSDDELQRRTREQAMAFFQAYREQRVFLTRRISEPIRRYLQTVWDLSSEHDPSAALNAAFDDVAKAAKVELGVELLSLQTSALLGEDATRAAWPMPDDTPDTVTTYASLWLRERFKDFRPENERLRSGTIADADSDLGARRDRVWEGNRNLFLVHSWRPSEVQGQVADVSIRLEERPRRTGPLRDVRPLSQGLVERVEYNLGEKWFGGRSVVKTNAADDFKLDVSAFRSPLCLARVHFTDGDSVVLERYLDFAAVGPLESR